jgi:hypothetical protein
MEVRRRAPGEGRRRSRGESRFTGGCQELASLTTSYPCYVRGTVEDFGDGTGAAQHCG